MATKEDLISLIEAVSSRVDVAKMRTLAEIVPKLANLDELLAHNAQTALDQIKHKADALLVSLPNNLRDTLLDLLPRTDSSALTIASHLLDYNLSPKLVILIHLSDVLDPNQDIPQLRDGLSAHFRRFLENNPETHLVFMSHDSADISTVLVTTLCSRSHLDNGRVSIIYESGLGLYFGAEEKRKHDFTNELKTNVMDIIERMAVAAASIVKDNNFHDRFYFSASEYSFGIKVHPFARGASTDKLDKEAANQLVHLLAVALSDLVKEEVSAIESHLYNHFLKEDPNLNTVFDKSTDERVWDVEIINQYLTNLSFVHLGSRGSIIRPSEATDVPAAETVLSYFGKGCGLICATNSRYSLPILEWAISKDNALIACSEDADMDVRRLVENRGGIEYNAGEMDELLRILDTYIALKKLI